MIKAASKQWWLFTAVSFVAVLASACQAAPTPTAGGSPTPGPARTVAPSVGSLAPDFTVKTPDGKTVTLSDLRGTPVMVNFWATWCPPCKQEMPLIQGIYTNKQYQKLSIVAVDQDEDAATVTQFLQQNGYTYPVVLDPGLPVSNRYQVYAIPTTFLIGTDGVIRAKKIGAFQSASELQSDLKMIVQ